jgi:toxin-antitoxin system PIN domain toxin
VIAVDTNVLVNAHRRDAEWHGAASTVVAALAEGDAPWAIPWPCAHEFVAIATHPRIFDPPSTTDEAVEQFAAWRASPSVVLLNEGPGYWERFAQLVREGGVRGPRIHDARVAAICLTHGVRELLTGDRDFGRFPTLRTRNPLVTRI